MQLSYHVVCPVVNPPRSAAALMPTHAARRSMQEEGRRTVPPAGIVANGVRGVVLSKMLYL